jgi:hypothetical protein
MAGMNAQPRLAATACAQTPTASVRWRTQYGGGRLDEYRLALYAAEHTSPISDINVLDLR